MSILFYDDSPVFGGHEVMSLLGLEAVLADFPGHVHFMASAANEKLCQKITSISHHHPRLTLESLDYHSSKLEALRNRLMPSRTSALAARFQELHPSLIVAIQGNIEHSSLSLHAARRTAIPAISYIPVPHSNAAMGARLGSLRDAFCSHLFKLPDAFITITDEMALLLELQGVTAPIQIVYNGVDTSRFVPGDALAACSTLGLPPDKTRLAVIGRIEFRQKQQHLLVQAIASSPELAKSCHLVFAGDGPDLAALNDLIAKHQLSATMLPWCDPAPLYQALDALIIPSRYEGLPLVMLEALSSGTPVLGSNRDGMKDLLPPLWRFMPNSVSSLAATISRFIDSGPPRAPAILVNKVRNTMSLAAFQHSFSDAILSHLQNGPTSPYP